MNEEKTKNIQYWRKILDVSRCDSWKIVNAKYKRLGLFIHPDKNPHNDDDEKQQHQKLFYEITEAKEELYKLYKMHDMNISPELRRMCDDL